MYNFHTVEQILKKKEAIHQRQSKDKLWMKKYIQNDRPALISKHQRRITGFAKKMETQPVILPEEQPSFSKQKKSKPESTHRLPWEQKQRTNLGLQHHTRTFSEFRILKTHKNVSQKYDTPIQSFRDRQKNKQINPPMKYCRMGIKNKELLKNKNKNVKSNKISQESKSNEQQSDYNLSQVDIVSLNNFALQNKLQKEFKTEKQKREQEQLKALSRDRIYFKSLIRFQENMKDETVKHCLKDILVKCRVIKPCKQRKRQITEQDLFAQIMKLNKRPSSQLKK